MDRFLRKRTRNLMTGSESEYDSHSLVANGPAASSVPSGATTWWTTERNTFSASSFSNFRLLDMGAQLARDISAVHGCGNSPSACLPFVAVVRIVLVLHPNVAADALKTFPCCRFDVVWVLVRGLDPSSRKIGFGLCTWLQLLPLCCTGCVRAHTRTRLVCLVAATKDGRLQAASDARICPLPCGCLDESTLR